MTRLLSPKKSRVLEIGTGSGYQTALLAEFSAEVYTIEIIKELSIKHNKDFQHLAIPIYFIRYLMVVQVGKKCPLTES